MGLVDSVDFKICARFETGDQSDIVGGWRCTEVLSGLKFDDLFYFLRKLPEAIKQLLRIFMSAPALGLGQHFEEYNVGYHKQVFPLRLVDDFPFNKVAELVGVCGKPANSIGEFIGSHRISVEVPAESLFVNLHEGNGFGYGLFN